MFKREFPSLNAAPSILGFGLMRLPTKGLLSKIIGGIEKSQVVLSNIDYEQGYKMVDCAILSGVNYFDTSWIYHAGKSEAFIREALKKYPRESYYLADKMPGWEVRNPADAERIFAGQLERCGTDYFDFYLCHSLSKGSFKKYERFLLDILIQKKKEGKIKRLGFSFHDDAENIGAIADAYPWEFAQIQLNYFDWKAQNAKLQYEQLFKRNIPVIVMEPVRGGSLAKLPQRAEKILKGAQPDKSAASWALRFCMSLPGVAVVLSGMSNLDHVRDNIETAQNFAPLNESEQKTLWAAEAVYRGKTVVPCTGCRYCMDCPHGVDIPKNFELFNEHTVFKVPISDTEWIKRQQKELGAAAASSCKSCGVCEKHCPQRIKISKWMGKIRI
ncbi:MAG: aldo/keto reductase [Firmicutes bacterium]|nr:aldo/keto reductase [Bacillota bacterium]